MFVSYSDVTKVVIENEVSGFEKIDIESSPIWDKNAIFVNRIEETGSSRAQASYPLRCKCRMFVPEY